MRVLDPKKDVALNKVSAHLTKTFCEVGGVAEPISGDCLPRLAFAAPGTYVIFGLTEWARVLHQYDQFGKFFSKRQPFNIEFEYLCHRDQEPDHVAVHHIFLFMDIYMNEGEVYFFEGGTVKDLPYVCL